MTDDTDDKPKSDHYCCVRGCPAAGVFSSSTTGGGPWYCPWHWREPFGPEAERITEDLRRPGGLAAAIERRYGPTPRRATDALVAERIKRDFPDRPDVLFDDEHRIPAAKPKGDHGQEG